MAFRQVNSPSPPEFAEPVSRKPLEVLRDTERALRLRTVDALVPLLPEEPALRLEDASDVAEDFLEELATIDLETITDTDLRPARIQVGLGFVGFGGLMVAFLLLYRHTLHPELTTIVQVQRYWYEYVWFVSLGVAGMFVLGREAMRDREIEMKDP